MSGPVPVFATITTICTDLSTIYPVGATFLYCSLNQLLSSCFVSLTNEIDELSAETVGAVVEASSELADRVRKWKRQHRILYEASHQLNRCFGFILLSKAAAAFVFMINFSFLCLILYDDVPSLVRFLFYIAVLLADLWSVCYTTDDVRTQVYVQPATLRIKTNQLKYVEFTEQAFEFQRALLEIELKYPSYKRQVWPNCKELLNKSINQCIICLVCRIKFPSASLRTSESSLGIFPHQPPYRLNSKSRRRIQGVRN